MYLTKKKILATYMYIINTCIHKYVSFTPENTTTKEEKYTVRCEIINYMMYIPPRL